MKSEKKTKILVVAPRFPAINQSWMDTYLEQLIRQELNFNIYSANTNPQGYQEKVDKLKLLERVIDFKLFSRKNLAKHAIRHPLKNIFAAFLALSSSAPFRQRGSGAISSWLKNYYFLALSDQFSEFTLIHAHEEIAAYQFLYLAKSCDIPLILTFHGLPPAGVGQLSEKKRAILYQQAEKIIVNTQFSKKQVVKLGCPEDKIQVLPQGISLEEFKFSPNAAPIVSMKTPLQLLTVGRYHHDKGQSYGLIALKRLLMSGFHAHYSLVGVGRIGRKKLEKLVDRLSLKEHVSFHENISSEELRKFYGKSHLFLFLSLSAGKKITHEETQGVALQEAQASGCIAIATKIGGIPECVHDSKDAILIRDRSSNEIEKTIRRMASNPEQWIPIQTAARKNIEDNYCAEKIGKKMSHILLQACKAERSRTQ